MITAQKKYTKAILRKLNYWIKSGAVTARIDHAKGLCIVTLIIDDKPRYVRKKRSMANVITILDRINTIAPDVLTNDCCNEVFDGDNLYIVKPIQRCHWSLNRAHHDFCIIMGYLMNRKGNQ